MLQPARRKYRKEQKGRNTGISHTAGTNVSFGEFGLKAVAVVVSLRVRSKRRVVP
jgi:large subunit ribosomal protein L16